MLTPFFSIGLIVLLGAMLPGPNFAIVSKNSIFHSRRSGLFTSLGIGVAILVQISYCIFAWAWVSSHFLLLFNLLKYAGAGYLVFLGVSFILMKLPQHLAGGSHIRLKPRELSGLKSFSQGFLCNLLNINSLLFYLALFLGLTRPSTSWFWEWQLAYTLEIILIPTLWYASLTLILSHRRVMRRLEKAEKYIAKILGIILIVFGAALVFVK